MRDLGEIAGADQTGNNWPKTGREKLYLKERNGQGGF
jgi:hypothetical protein